MNSHKQNEEQHIIRDIKGTDTCYCHTKDNEFICLFDLLSHSDVHNFADSLSYALFDRSNFGCTLTTEGDSYTMASTAKGCRLAVMNACIFLSVCRKCNLSFQSHAHHFPDYIFSRHAQLFRCFMMHGTRWPSVCKRSN
jgi:hypothetical protein